MEFQVEQAVAVLRRTPAMLSALLRGLPEAWTRGAAGPETWSAYDIVGHLLYGDEANWMERARAILEGGERPFGAFNRTGMFTAYAGASLDDLLTMLEATRAANLAELEAWRLTPEQLAQTGAHPALGSVTLSQLLAAWVAHDLNHIGQVVEVMARQYAEAVGPWRAFLAILNRPILTE